MKKESKPNNKKLAEVKATETDYPEIPELDSSFFENAELVIPEPQKSISLSIDSDVLSWFKKTGRGYQTKMNAALRMFMEGQA